MLTLLVWLGWLGCVALGCVFGFSAFTALMFDGFMGHSSCGAQWIYLVLAIIFFTGSYFLCPFAMVLV